MSLLFSPTKLGSLTLKNRLVMSPLTRSRATGNVPNDLMVEYYAQRAPSAGLIITEGTSPSPNGLGYPRIPGSFLRRASRGLEERDRCGSRPAARKIFMQFMHTGRIGHPNNLPAGATVVGPSAIAAAGEMYTDAEGHEAAPDAESDDRGGHQEHAIGEYVQAAKNAMAAGFDGIELHGANGYLLEQFIRPNSNQRTDGYGGVDREPRALRARSRRGDDRGDRQGQSRHPAVAVWRVQRHAALSGDGGGLHLSGPRAQRVGLLYVHLVDHSSMGAPIVPQSIKATFRKEFKGALILSGGYDAARAESDLAAGQGDLIAVGKPLPRQPGSGGALESRRGAQPADSTTFYTPGPKGYTDYPVLAKQPEHA